MEKEKLWMGVGISNNYVQYLKKLQVFVTENYYSEVLLIFADEINKKYNERDKDQFSKDLFNFAKKLSNKLKDTKLILKKWSFLSKNKGYLNILKHYTLLYKKDKNFKKDVLEVVLKNRKIFSQGKEEKRANYVLEELSSILFFFRQGYTKVGPLEKEKVFDDLAKKYSKEELNFKWF